jgi:acyl carrier protein
MKKEKIIDKYDGVFIKSFKIKKGKLKNLKYDSIPQWDSVGHMSMIGHLEEVFKISLEMDDIIDFSSYEFGKKILKKYKLKI